MHDIVSSHSRDISNLKDEERRIAELMKTRFEDSEKISKFNLDSMS